MSTLIEIPDCSVYHLPTPASDPLPLSSGTLTLVLLPPSPSTHNAETLTLTIGASSFPLSPKLPIQKLKSKDEHPWYSFSPAPPAPDGSQPVGQVRFTTKHSKSQDEWEATEASLKSFEEYLQTHNVWDERTLFVDDEWETGGETTAKPGWGETFAQTIIGAGHSLANRIHEYTDRHIAHTNPEQPAPPSETTANAARAAKETTDTFATKAEAASTVIGNTVHAGGSAAASYLPDSVRPGQPVKEEEKSNFRKMAEEGWEQVGFAAKGVVEAASSVGGAISGDSHKAIEHNFGKEAEGVAQDIGQSGANVGSSAASAVKGTSIAVQGANVGSGIATGGKPTEPEA
ncbi:hypothetical protein I308_105233 [Cryptococcus tetragattii IND107]|uniref:Senescence domain-containing protein n=1 Tax=Cryptococcus tetragattii IND107 TaxID=1296105 RepID=A0ABR3BME4_9TREE|nr:hypothetical protein I308_05990 [Cryptococcus tetragattii IND107]